MVNIFGARSSLYFICVVVGVCTGIARVKCLTSWSNSLRPFRPARDSYRAAAPYQSVSETTMKIRGRPIGIWLICLILILGIFEELYIWVFYEPFTIESLMIVSVSLVFCTGLFSFNKWVCIAFVFICGMSSLVVIFAAIIVLDTNSVGAGNSWSALISVHWRDAWAVVFFWWCVYYLTRRDVRDLFIANKSNQPGTPKSGASV